MAPDRPAWHDVPVLTTVASPVLSRRSSFRLAGIAAVGVVGVSTVAACSNGDDAAPEPPDPLIAQEEAARQNAADARSAAALAPDRTAALTLIAAERTAHADALRTEVARLVGTYPDGSTPSADPTTTQSSVAPAPPPAVDALRAQLVGAQNSAAALARTQSDYRAGLLGSISAACAVHAGVLLR
ncbi:hypothetical protein [Antrihabitans cavernicola]|uniref:Uncharacterized protein n=1 Tax=Antrihabitans cavernicola TaxID=2495913 RepID=A0A5A7SF03_9NOCA|nr:hypothetical protein [Spelaeibacter cavernicola]KAA0023287.1 hypothetical protein FOY51_07645 [Spelaeibacter cavernicola]